MGVFFVSALPGNGVAVLRDLPYRLRAIPSVV